MSETQCHESCTVLMMCVCLCHGSYIGSRTNFSVDGAHRPLSAVVAQTVRDVATAAEKDFERVYQDHVRSFSAIFDRTQLDLGPSRHPSRHWGVGGGAKSTRERLSGFRKTAAGQAGVAGAFAADPQLVSLYFHYGRYMLMSSSKGTHSRQLLRVRLTVSPFRASLLSRSST
jgi:alpha-L-fucosidase 2